MIIKGLLESFNKISANYGDSKAYDEETFSLLIFGAFEVGYFYLESKEEIHYVAHVSHYRDIDIFPVPYIEVIVSLDGRILPTQNNFSTTSEVSSYQLALIAYILKRDEELEKKDSSAYLNFYEPILEKIKDFIDLPPLEQKEREETRNAFLNYFHSANPYEALPKGKKPKNPYQISANLHVYGKENYELEIEIFDDGKRIVKFPSRARANDFLISYQNDGNFQTRTKLYAVGKDYFSPKAKEIMSFLIGSGAFYRLEEGRGFLLSKSDTVTLVSLCRGTEISLENVPYYVTKDTINGHLFLKEDNTVDLLPSRELIERSFLLYSKKDLLLWNATSRVVEHYVFKDEANLKMYLFFARNPKAKVSYIKDLLLKEGGFETSFLPQEEGNHHLNISLYIDINDEGKLLFKTTYSLFGENKERSFLLKSVFYRAVVSRYEDELKRVHAIPDGLISNEEAIISFLEADLTRLKKICHVYLSERFGKVQVTSVGSLNVYASKSADWLSLSLASDKFSSEELSIILASYKKKKKFVLLRNKAVLLKDEELSDALRLKEEAKLDKHLQNNALPTYQAFKLSQMESQLALNLGTYCKDLVRDLALFKDKKLILSSKLMKELRPYQVDAVKWLSVLYQYELGGILADDMGLGKTLETISFFSLLNSNRPSLVIAPKSVVYNWESEFHKWAPLEKVIVIDGLKNDRFAKIKSVKNDERIFYITSYDSLRSDIEGYKDKQFDVVVVDEAQYIKNGLALKSKAVRTLKSRFRLALTGTPIENSLSDLWSIFDFLMPGYLDSFPVFKTRYILAGNQVESRARLSKKVMPFILRRSKSEVLKDLPEKSTGIIRLTMNEEARKLYDAYLQDAREKLKAIHTKDHEKASSEIFSMLPVLTRLREICVDPSAFFDGFSEISNKLDYALSLIDNALRSNHKILVFSAFTKVLDHFQKMLLEANIASYYIHGGVDAKTRLLLSSTFNQEGSTNVMLVSLKAGGTGLNLQGADIVLHLDPWWNAAAEEQATDRAYRIGQKRPVSVIKLISYNTIEERVLALQEEKQALYSAIIRSGDEAITKLSFDDISFLLDA